MARMWMAETEGAVEGLEMITNSLVINQEDNGHQVWTKGGEVALKVHFPSEKVGTTKLHKKDLQAWMAGGE